MRHDRHVFVCVNTRPPGTQPCCTGSDSLAILQGLQEEALRKDVLHRVAFNGSTCLGPCEDGPVMVVYPEGVWYKGVTAADVPEIVLEHFIRGRPVERLQYSWPLV